MPRIFISYKRADKDKVFPIKDKIETAIGEPCWIDLDGIESDAQFVNIIMRAIDDSEIFLFMYSKCHAHIEEFETDWTVREINYAQRKHKRIVIVNIDQTPLIGWFEFMFSLKQQIDATSLSIQNKLIEDIKTWLLIDRKEKQPHTELQTKLENGSDLKISVDELIKLAFQHKSSQDFNKAFECFQLAANMGNPVAQYELGNFYVEGNCVEGNEELSTYWYNKSFEGLKRSVDNGDINAMSMYYYGNCYYCGIGVECNDKEAFKWYLKAAKENFVVACHKVGDCYDFGFGVRENKKEAFKWYLKAAEQGDAKSQYEVGWCYQTGVGVKNNEDSAIYWFKLAAQQDYARAYIHLAELYEEKGDFIQSLRWYEIAADSGDEDALYKLGEVYTKGTWAKKDIKKAETFFQRAVEGFQNSLVYNEKDEDALYKLGVCYYNGYGVKKDKRKAHQLFKKADKFGSLEAFEALCEYYDE